MNTTIVNDADELSPIECANQIVWFNINNRGEDINLRDYFIVNFLKKKFEDTPIYRYIRGVPGSGKTMMAKAIQGEYLLNKDNIYDKFDTEPIYISLNTAAEYCKDNENFSDILSYRIILAIVQLNEDFKKISLLQRLIKKIKRTDLDVVQIDKNLRTISEKNIESATLKIQYSPFQGKGKKKVEKQIRTMTPKDVLFEYLNILRKNKLKITFIFDNIDKIAKQNMMKEFIKFSKNLHETYRFGIAIFIYPIVENAIRDSGFEDHKIIEKSISISLENKIFNKTERERYFTSIAKKRTNINADGVAATYAIFGAMGNVRKFLTLVKESKSNGSIHHQKVKSKLVDNDFWTEYFDNYLTEIVDSYYTSSSSAQKATIKLFYHSILKRMKRHRKEFGPDHQNTREIENDLSKIHPVFVEISLDFYEHFEQYISILINSGYLLFANQTQIHKFDNSQGLYLLPLTVLSGAVKPELTVVKENNKEISLLGGIKGKISGSASSYNRIFNLNSAASFLKRNKISKMAMVCPLSLNDEEFSKTEFRGINKRFCPKCKNLLSPNRKGKYPRHCPDCDALLDID